MTYKVRSGDTLGGISQRFGVTVYAVATANGIRDVNSIFVGQMLRIPGGVDSKGGSGQSGNSSVPATPNNSGQIPIHELGILSRTYEARGRPETVSSGVGDAGGVSYGAYQFATNTGTAKEFVDFLKPRYPTYYAALSGKAPGSSSFGAAWKKLAAKDPKGFFNAQHDFIKVTHYDPIVAEIKSAVGLDVTTRSKTLQDVTWSTAVQHRHTSDNIFKRALNGRKPEALSDEELIKAVYAERGRRNAKRELVYFSNNPKNIQESVAKRFLSEQKDALAALARERAAGKGGGAKSGSPVSSSTTPAGGKSPTPKVTPVSGKTPGASAAQVQARHIDVPYFSQFKSYYDSTKKLRFTPGKTSCFKASVAMAHAVGVTVLGSDSRIQVATSENGKGQVQVNAKKAAEAVRYIGAELDAGRPVVVGVSHKDADYNVDAITDHFVVITGRTVDEKGRLCYPFHDPGTSHEHLGKDTQPTNRFYVDGSGSLIRPGKLAEGSTLARRLELAMVRLNKGTKPPASVQDVPKQEPKPTPMASQQVGGLPDTRGMTEARKYDLYARYFEAKGKRLDSIPEHCTVLGLRVQTNTRANKKLGVYDDRIVVLWTTATGEKKVLEFEANTEPSSRYEGTQGGDANGDGKLDLGRLPEGTYSYSSTPERHAKLGVVFRTTHNDIVLERDTNHDGAFTKADKVTNRAALSSWKSILFHKGGNNMTGSAGCQTMRPDQYAKFQSVISKAPQREFQYTLINVTSSVA